jgi:hypothetical protein
MKKAVLLAALIWFTNLLVAQEGSYHNLKREVQPDLLKDDINKWLDWVHEMHPDLSYTVKDIDKFYWTVSHLKDSISVPMTVLDFWKHISPLNNQLSDGHMIIGLVNQGIVTDYLTNQKRFFPFEVVIQKNELLISSVLGGGETDLIGSSILEINSIPIDSVLRSLLIRINGDSDRHRKALLEKKFSLFYMMFFGESDDFTIKVKQGNNKITIVQDGLCVLPEIYGLKSFEDNFDFELINKKTAILRVREFYWEDKEKYYNFMDSVFSVLTAIDIAHLIIDIRENGGGDDEFWMSGILKYIADQPYNWGSNYQKKIIERYRDPGEVIGTVKAGVIDTLITTEKDIRNKFRGKVSVLIGPYTYSSAILFANTVQDFNFGQLVGEPTGGKSGQTGGIQFFKMPHSNLLAVTPRFYLERPRGGGLNEPVVPDVLISYDKLNHHELIDTLLKK